MGKKSRHELAEEFNSSNVLIHGSYFETFGLVVCEAMAMGLPTISTITDGSKEIISPQFGVLVNQNDPSDMLKAMFVFIIIIGNIILIQSEIIFMKNFLRYSI